MRVGNAAVKVYRMKHPTARTGWTFVLAWQSPAGRKRRKITDEAEAMSEARLLASQLNAGRVNAGDLTQADRDELFACRELAGDLSSVLALREWAAARNLVGADLLAAAEHWAARKGRLAKRVTVAEATKRFLEAKRRDEVDTKAGYERSLPAFVEALGERSIAEVSPDVIADYLQRYTNPASRNSHRKRIVSLFRWCRKRGILPLDIQTAPERVDTARQARVEIGLVTTDELRRAFDLIAEKAPEYLPALAVSVFCGLRRAEVHGQRWEHIDLERCLLRVSAAKPNTPAHRLVPLPPAAVQWLAPLRQAKGPICPNLAVDRIRDICRTAGLDLARNGFRHSWISARVAVTGNIPETAIEAGNSPSILVRHYRELLRKDEAAAWFAVLPVAPANLVAFAKERAAHA